MVHTITSERPWGSFTRFTHNEFSTVKLLHIKRGEQLSLQYHNHREEFWNIVEGNPEIIIGDTTSYAHPGEEFSVPLHTPHRISAPIDDVIILEISTGDFDEDDIVRIEDKYDRIVN